MKITYIEHSCFSVELDNVIILFDYFKGQLPAFDEEKTICVFSSHNHHDHFNISIFQLLKRYPNVKYFLSRDIKRKFGRKFFNTHGVDDDVYEKIEFVGSDQIIETLQLKIETLKSTDEGVAFIVTADGKTIYHAGDLNLWAWNHKDKSNNENMRELFEKEIAKIKNRHFEAAFLVLDPRQEELFHLGFDYFMKNTNTDKVYPMHFWNDSSVIDILKAMDCSEIYREKIISQKGPYSVDVEEGKTYYWCACGRTGSQPFCDGSHKETSFTPVAYVAEKTETVHFCGCRHTKNPPLCDGSHHNI